MEELQLNNELGLESDNEELDKCPVCGKRRFWFKYYCNTPIKLCNDCGYFEDIYCDDKLD